MKKMMIITSILAFVLGCEKKDTPESNGNKVFAFTAIPDQNATDLEERYAAVTTYLESKLGMKVKYYPQKDYPASVTAFKNNDVQLAWFGGLTGVQARKAVPGSQVIAQGVEDPQYMTFFIAHSSSGIKMSDTFPDMKKRTFTFGSKSSTSGRLMPEYFISKETGLAPDKYFAKVGYSGDHSKTMTLVEAGAYDVGALSYKVWEKAVQEKKVDTSKVKLIWKTPYYPDYNWSIRGDVDETFGKGFTAKVQRALLDLKDGELLNHFNRSGFIPGTNEMFTPIYHTAKELQLID